MRSRVISLDRRQFGCGGSREAGEHDAIGERDCPEALIVIFFPKDTTRPGIEGVHARFLDETVDDARARRVVELRAHNPALPASPNPVALKIRFPSNAAPPKNPPVSPPKTTLVAQIGRPLISSSK